MFKEYSDILSVSQTAKALGVGKKAVYTLVKNHELGCMYIGKTIKIPKMCLEDFVRKARNHVKL